MTAEEIAALRSTLESADATEIRKLAELMARLRRMAARGGVLGWRRLR